MKSTAPKISDALPERFQAAFKDADIRGVYPTEINETVAYRAARAFVEEFSLSRVIVARDMRESSPALRAAFVAGVQDAGADVLDIGKVGTPALYYAAGTYDTYGVMITASHNPKEYNGLKLVKAGAIPLTRKTGLGAIARRIQKNVFLASKQRGQVKKKAILREYTKYVREKVALTPSRPLRIVVDAGNGMATTLANLLCERLPIEITPLFFTLDGAFPNRGSNPTLAKNQKAIKAELKRGDYDFGVAFDGDADRVAFFDERGRYVNSAVIGALIANTLLKEQPKQKCVYTVFTSRAYVESIKEAGGVPVKARVGHAFIKEVMRKRGAVFACEHSAHFYFQDNFFTDSGILALLYVAAAYAEVQADNSCSFSRLLQPYARYHQTEEVLLKVKDKKAALQRMQKHYEQAGAKKVTVYDGVTVEFDEYWLVVKESVTEDALKFVVESSTAATAKAVQKQVLRLLRDS